MLSASGCSLDCSGRDLDDEGVRILLGVGLAHDVATDRPGLEQLLCPPPDLLARHAGQEPARGGGLVVQHDVRAPWEKKGKKGKKRGKKKGW